MSLLDLQPHKVSRDLRGYSVLFYGEPKSGKTTIASSSLVLCFLLLRKVILLCLVFSLSPLITGLNS